MKSASGSKPVKPVLYLPLWLLLATFVPAQSGSAPTAKGTAIQQADAAFRAGYSAMQAGELEKAQLDFARAVRLAPGMAEPRVALGAILVQLGKPTQAIVELQSALALKPGDVNAEANLAMAHEAQGRGLAAVGKTSEAEAEMRAGIAAIHTQPDAHQLATMQDELGSLLAQQKRWPEAEGAFREALRVTPDPTEDAGTHMHLGTVLVEEQRVEEAVTELRLAVEASKTGGQAGNAMAEYQLGHALVVAGKDEDAELPLEQALKLNPELAGGPLELAMVLQRLGRQEESIPLFEKAVKAEPGNAVALTNLGLALTQTGRAKEAVTYFERALTETPSDPVVHEDLGVARLQQSEFDAAIGEFEKARAVAPEDPQVHYDLGLAYKLKDRMDDAIRELTEAERLDSALPDPPYTLGILLMQLGRLPEAVDQLRVALTLRPENGDGWAILGSVLKQSSRRPEAIEALRKAIQLLPNQPGPHITLAGVLAEQGEGAEAASERKRAAELSRTAVNRQRAVFSTNAGNQLLSRGEIEQAVARYLEAISADPGFSEPHGQLAVAYTRQGRTAEAATERAKAESRTKVP